MRFVNKGSDIQVRIKEKNLYGGVGYKWKSIGANEIVDLPEEIGILNNLEKVTTTGQIGKVIVETKQIENDFYNELCLIKGIGKKTAKDIIKIFPDREGLKQIIKNNETLPFRDDVEKLLKKEYSQ